MFHSDYNPLMSLFIHCSCCPRFGSLEFLLFGSCVFSVCLHHCPLAAFLRPLWVSVLCPSSPGPSAGEWGLEMDSRLQMCSWWLCSCLFLGPSCRPSWRVSAYTLLYLFCVRDATCLTSHPWHSESSCWLSFSSSRQPGCHSSPCLC